HFSALPYPGMPTDLQAQFTTLAALADGHSTIADPVFPHRFAHVDELNRLGAKIQYHKGAVSITGVDQLRSPQYDRTDVYSTDLRASAALVLAGLSAPGHTVVREAYHLHRGYESLAKKLQSLGAEIHTGHSEMQ